jgi:dCTP deaminase
MSLRPGVLPFQWLARALAQGWIVSPVQVVEERQLQPASLDLRLGTVAYRMRSSLFPLPLPRSWNGVMSISFRSWKS